MPARERTTDAGEVGGSARAHAAAFPSRTASDAHRPQSSFVKILRHAAHSHPRMRQHHLHSESSALRESRILIPSIRPNINIYLDHSRYN